MELLESMGAGQAVSNHRVVVTGTSSSDADTYVNTPAIVERLRCFNSEEKQYLGAIHAVQPT